MKYTWMDFAEKLSIIYRFPGGNIFLNKREYFVTLVERQTVEDVSQQDERSCSRADAYMKGSKGKKSSSLQVLRWSRQMSLSLNWFKAILQTQKVTHLLLPNRCSDRWETGSHHSSTSAQPAGKINTRWSDFRLTTFDDNSDCSFTHNLIAQNPSQRLVKSSFLFCLAVTNVFCILEV